MNKDNIERGIALAAVVAPYVAVEAANFQIALEGENQQGENTEQDIVSATPVFINIEGTPYELTQRSELVNQSVRRALEFYNENFRVRNLVPNMQGVTVLIPGILEDQPNGEALPTAVAPSQEDQSVLPAMVIGPDLTLFVPGEPIMPDNLADLPGERYLGYLANNDSLWRAIQLYDENNIFVEGVTRENIPEVFFNLTVDNRVLVYDAQGHVLADGYVDVEANNPFVVYLQNENYRFDVGQNRWIEVALAPEVASLELTINSPERLGNIELITSVPVTLPNGTQTMIRMWGNSQRLIDAGYSPGRFTSDSAGPVQQLADMTLLNTDNNINMLSYNRYETQNGDGRPNESGFRDGEALVENVDLSKPVNIIVIPDVQNFPEIAGYTFNNGEPTNGFYISNRSDGQLEIYYYPGRIETKLYHWRDVLGLPEEELRAQTFVFSVPATLAVIAMFQQNEIEGRINYQDLSQDFSMRARTHNSPWSPEWVDATIPVQRYLLSTMEPFSPTPQTQ